MHKFERNLLTEWRRLELPIANATVLVAVSGGADSSALFIALAELAKRKKIHLEIVAAHFNHRFRGRESDGDERFVKEMAVKLGLDLVSGTERLEGSADIEQRARNARYKFLAAAAKEVDARLVLTAHTMNDQAETVLLNLIRGSGPDGLAGMRLRRHLETDIEVVRPLLKWSKRADTNEYCRSREVEPRQDAMNQDPRFTRVRIRKEIIPLLGELNPKIVETLSRTGELLGSARGPHSPTDQAQVSKLKNLNESELRTGLRDWLRSSRGSLRGITLKHIDSIARLVKSRRSGRIVELPGGGRVEKCGGRLAYKDIKLEN